MWVKVTKDEYELPEAVADTAAELAKMFGVSRFAVRDSASHYRHGKIKKPVFLKIEEGDEDALD